MRKNTLKVSLLAGVLIATLALMGGCVPAAPAGETQGFDWSIVIFMALIFAVFYFLIMRPQRKKQQQHQALVQELGKGDKVITAGGIYGQIESLSEDSIVLKIESGATIRIARASIVGRREK